MNKITTKKFIPKKLVWKKRCNGLYGGFIGDIEVMQVVKCDGDPEWYYHFTGYTYLIELPRKTLSRPLFKKYTTAKKAAEKEYLESFKLMVKHLFEISENK